MEKINSKYEILTDSGFKNFSGIKKQEVDNYYRLIFDDSTTLECSISHKIKLIDNKFKYAFQLLIGDITSSNKKITKIEELNESQYVYDILGVEDTQAYTTNGVESHNCAFVEDWDEFYKSVYPTISSGQETKVVFTSTPNSLNHYYHLWNGAIKGPDAVGGNSFVPIKVTWKDVPGRDEKWKAQTIANTSQEAFVQEHEAEFIGSSATLIDGWKLKELEFWEPLSKNDYTAIYELPNKESEYVVVCDVSRGKGIDNSAFIVVKTSELPYKIVATYYCPNIPPDMYSEVIYRAHKHYNDAYVVVENNDAGCETLRVLHDTYECEMLLGIQTNTGFFKSKKLSLNGGQGFELGVRTDKKVKAVGCARLKTLVENNTLVFGDRTLIDELNRYSRKGTSYAAEEGAHDDLVACIHGNAIVDTEDGPMKMRELVKSHYTGKVASVSKDGKIEYKRVLAHSEKFNTSKKWVGLRGKSRNILLCTTDHKVAYIDNVFDVGEIKYTEAENMIGKISVRQPTKEKFHITNTLYNKTQMSAMIGIILGDGHINKSGKLYCTHGPEQEEYSKHKTWLLGGVYRESHHKSQKNKACHGSYPTNEQTRQLRELMYDNNGGIKTPRPIIDMIDDIALAYWYMDDGYMTNKEGKSQSIILCTDSFTEEDIELLITKLNTTFKFHSYIMYSNGKPRIRITSDTAHIFWNIISPYVNNIQCMQYKIPEKYRNNKTISLSNIKLDIGAEKIDRILDRSGAGYESKLYDIQVEDNNNFIVNGILVHNCTVMFSWLTTQDIFVDMTNIEVRENIRDNYESRFEEELLPFGYIYDGMDYDSGFIEDYDSTRHLLGRGNNIETPGYRDFYNILGADEDDPTIFPLPTIGVVAN